MSFTNYRLRQFLATPWTYVFVVRCSLLGSVLPFWKQIPAGIFVTDIKDPGCFGCLIHLDTPKRAGEKNGDDTTGDSKDQTASSSSPMLSKHNPRLMTVREKPWEYPTFPN